MSGFFSSNKKATSASANEGGPSVQYLDSTKDMRFTIHPLPGDTGFSQWAAAMKMVAQLPGGIPTEFRRRLWLTLAERHLVARGVSWSEVERTSFSEWSHPADAELGVQIVKDLHRTGCSLFCGEDGQENQALLKRVLLAYARWNKAVGYCQGFNMLAALILQVTEKSEGDALKLMIYLIEGVLPDSYFADSLRGLSVDMAVFRELLKSRLPALSKHLDLLQNAAKDGSRSYEPPLTNVFTMQWFLTLFCNCLPHSTVLRVWDLILLEGNEILLRTSIAIWQVLAERILTVRSADEFYCVMGVLMRELLEFDLIDGNSLVKAMVAIGPLTELKTLREHYLYNINPWGSSLPQGIDKQLKLYSKQSIALDISALKKQYGKLKQRQRQAHIIFSAAISRHPTPTPPVTINHLLIGKTALVSAKRLGPPKGSIPPIRQAPSTLHWKDTTKQTSSSSSSDTELCDEEMDSSDEEDVQTNQFDNLPLDSDTDLMKNDNTYASLEKIPSNTIQYPLTKNPKISENLMISKSDSDDEIFDFEQFLADRVKCLKVTEDEQEEKINYSRRNSARALEIIQENSMILHRILQCQSRLSPSPPYSHSGDIIAADNVSDVSGYFSLQLHREIDTDNGVDIEALKSPEYGSKYSSILEKSKSLNDKYNKLILKNTVSRTTEELNTNIENKTIDISYSNKDKLKSTCPSETLSSLASFDSASNKINRMDLNLPVLVKEAIVLDKKYGVIKSIADSESTINYSELENQQILNITEEYTESTLNVGTEESQAKSNESEDICEAFRLAHSKNIIVDFSSLRSYDIDSGITELGPSSHSDFESPEPTRLKFGLLDEDIGRDYASINKNSESWATNLQSYLGKQLSPTSKVVAEPEVINYAASFQVDFSETTSGTTNTTSTSSIAGSSNISLPIHSRENKSKLLLDDKENSMNSLLNDEYDSPNDVDEVSARTSPYEFDGSITEGNCKIEKDASSPSRTNHKFTSQVVKDKNIEQEEISTGFFRNPSFATDHKLSTIGSEYNKLLNNNCSIKENSLENIRHKTISIYSDPSPELTETSRDPSFCENPTVIKSTTLLELERYTNQLPQENIEAYDEYSPSSFKSYSSRSTSPFISDDWYSTERNNKNIGLEVVAVGGSSKSRSPPRSNSLSPIPSTIISKSPSKCFNPFPVPLASRQSKEVPMKLGLYKN